MARFNPCKPANASAPAQKAETISPSPRLAEPNGEKAGVRCDNITFSLNTEKAGLELRFAEKPADDVRARLKAAGFRWSRFGSCWYVKDTPEKRAWVENFLGGTGVPPVAAGVAPDAFKIAAGHLDYLFNHGFIGIAQRHALHAGFKGEEKQFFFDKVAEYAARIAAMPKTGETDGQGNAAVAHLHYFAGGQANWYITEKDMGAPDDAENGVPPQSQAFGLADLFGDGGELGYISLAEILSCGGELDLYWTPQTLAAIRDAGESPVPNGGRPQGQPSPVAPADDSADDTSAENTGNDMKLAELEPGEGFPKDLPPEPANIALTAPKAEPAAPPTAPVVIANDPEANLRRLWDAKGVPKDVQDAIITDTVAKAQPGAMVGPFQIPVTEVKTPAWRLRLRR